MNNMLKGKTAEKIVASMFKEAGFKVINYGYEYSFPKLADRSNLLKGKAGQYIRHQPDFVVVNKQNEAFFVEVKHRKDSIFPTKEIFPYPCCYVVLLTKKYIMAQSTEKLFAHKAGFEPIINMSPFKNIPRKLVWKYVLKTRRDLGDETWSGQLVEKYVEKITGKKLQEPQDTFKVIKEREPIKEEKKEEEKKYTCPKCGRKISQRGYCWPCNAALKRKRTNKGHVRGHKKRWKPKRKWKKYKSKGIGKDGTHRYLK